jgi:hypothetical protein
MVHGAESEKKDTGARSVDASAFLKLKKPPLGGFSIRLIIIHLQFR